MCASFDACMVAAPLGEVVIMSSNKTSLQLDEHYA